MSYTYQFCSRKDNLIATEPYSRAVLRAKSMRTSYMMPICQMDKTKSETANNRSFWQKTAPDFILLF
jgi:hypothetical protein